MQFSVSTATAIAPMEALRNEIADALLPRLLDEIDYG